MAPVVDIVDKELYYVLIDGEKLIDEYFMMGIFDGITKKLPQLQEYLDFMFDNKQGSLVGSRKEEDKVLSLYLLRSELFILLEKILSILTHFVLNSHAKHCQSSELSSGTSAGPHLSNYLQSVGRIE